MYFFKKSPSTYAIFWIICDHFSKRKKGKSAALKAKLVLQNVFMCIYWLLKEHDFLHYKHSLLSPGPYKGAWHFNCINIIFTPCHWSSPTESHTVPFYLLEESKVCNAQGEYSPLLQVFSALTSDASRKIKITQH